MLCGNDYTQCFMIAQSGVYFNGMPMAGLTGYDANFQRKIFERTQGSGAEVIRRKGGAGWAVGLTIAEVIHAIALDRKQLLPVSSMQQGVYGLNNVCLSVPTVIGRTGVLDQVELDLWPKEKQGIQNSARALKKIVAEVAVK